MSKSKIFKQIEEQIANNEIILFMKGTADFPQCGFSAMVVGILQNIGVKFKDVNVLTDNELRQSIKDFSDWPTIPQLYVRGEFIGGCDIVRELYENGQLSEILKHKNEDSSSILQQTVSNKTSLLENNISETKN